MGPTSVAGAFGATSTVPACRSPSWSAKMAAMTDTEQATRRLLVELLGVFYDKGWVSGTGGGICGPADGGGLLLAPSGVHKERV